MSDSALPVPAVPHDGTDAEARPVFATERKILGIGVSAWPGILAPVATGLFALAAWEIIVRVNAVPSYILPGPLLIAQTLVTDWGTLSGALWITLRITFAALVAAGVDRRLPGGGCSRSRNGWRSRSSRMRSSCR